MKNSQRSRRVESLHRIITFVRAKARERREMDMQARREIGRKLREYYEESDRIQEELRKHIQMMGEMDKRDSAMIDRLLVLQNRFFEHMSKDPLLQDSRDKLSSPGRLA